ncbi:excalibur calcium-binding domain-containing protein [Shewanella sp. 125m-7]
MLMERGKLVRWNQDKGFGFIQPDAANTHDVFIHISALKHMARKPMVGDQIMFVTERQPDGKLKASKANIEGVAVVANSATNKHRRNSSTHSNQGPIKSSFLAKLAIPLIIALAAVGYSKYQQMNETIVLTNDDVENMRWNLPAKPTRSLSSQPQFICESGKIHCSQMRSCDEAKFYNKNCPGTKMDGDGDGVPCERQHCSW